MLHPDKKKIIIRWLDIYLSLLGILSLASIIAIVGFYLSPELVRFFRVIIDIVIVTFIAQEFFRWFLVSKLKIYLKKRLIENLLALGLLVNIIAPTSILDIVTHLLPSWTIKDISMIYIGIIQSIILLSVLIRALRYNYLISRINLHPGAIFALSFALIIIIGTMFLLLPKSTPIGKGISFIDALFTSTSAVCVTGLIVVDTAKDFTPVGKFFIMMLIQIGGLGVMTLTTFFAVFLSGGVSYRVRIMMKDLLSQESLSEVTTLLIKILLFTIVIEAVGAFLLYLSLGGTISHLNVDYLEQSAFHSVSAFCNAGFSLYSVGLMEQQVNGNFYFSSIIMLLIVLGGLGFAVLSNIASLRPRKFKLRRIRYQLLGSTKLVLISTAILIIFGAWGLYIVEPFSFDKSLTLGDKIFHSLFQSVTTRTAGFNTLPIDLMAPPAVFIMIILMFIGASPGSTGGGIKTTTLALVLLSLLNLIRGKERVEIFHREIARESIQKSFLVLLSALIALSIGSFLLIWLEPDKDTLNLIFEASSALGTVGLSRGITAFLGLGGKFIIIILMFVGRIGVLTFLLAFLKPTAEPRYSMPKETIAVG